VASWGGFVVNGVVGTGTDIPTTFAGYEMTGQQLNDKEHVFVIKLDDIEKITFKTFKDWVSVKIDTSSMDRFGSSLGLMGSFKNGDMLARDGVAVLNAWNETIANPSIFADEWQVRGDSDGSLFLSTRSPQYPQKCILPSPKKDSSRRLGESLVKEAAEKACAHWAPEEVDMCIYDVMVSGDFELAAAGSY
jgi:hypothetical protein